MIYHARVRRMRWTGILASLGLATILSSLLATVSVSANSNSSGVPAGAVVSGMTLDCVDMSQKVHAYAVAHGYCPSTRQASPYGTTYGNCGSSWLLMWNEYSGDADFAHGFQSSQGNVVYRNLVIHWNNWRTSTSGSFSDAGWMNSSYYNTDHLVFTNTGYVTGSMSGTVQLIWGGTCAIIPPSDNVTVT